MTDFPTLTYEVLTVGEEFVSDEQIVTPEDIETYAFAVDDHHPWFSGPSPFGGPVAHPTFFGNQALRLRHTKYVVHAGLHAKMSFQFLEPIRPGMRVRSRGKIVDKYVRRDKKYMVTEFVTSEQTGVTLVRGQFTQMLIEPGTRVSSKPSTSDRAPAETATAAGEELPSLKKEISQ
jgi:acyl dehydratase